MKLDAHTRGYQIVEALAPHGGCYYDGYGGVIMHPYMYGAGFGELFCAELEQCSIAGVFVRTAYGQPRLSIEVDVHTDDDLKKLIELLHKYRALAAVTNVLEGL